MSDKLNNNITPDENNETLQPPKQNYEENDNWQFDGVAHTLENTVIENDELEIVIPKKESEFETRERPSAEKTSSAASPAEPREDSSNSVKFFTMAVFLLIMAGVLAFFGIRYYNTPNTTETLNPGNVAVTIGDTDVSIGMYNYYYNSTVNYYLQQASYGYVELDSTKSYASQKTTDEDGKEVTWEQRFKDDTLSQLQRLVAYYEAANKDGVKLTDEQKKQIDDDLEQVKAKASEEDMSVDEYISVNYGDYCGLATLKKMEEMSYSAQTYLRKATIEMVPDEERVNKYYEEHKEDYQQVEMCYLVMQYDEDTKADVIKQAKKYASQISNEKELKKLIPIACKDLIDAYVKNGTYGDADAVAEQIAKSSTMTVTKSNPNQLPQAIIDFLFDKNNKKGSCRTVADDDYKAVFIVLKNSGITVYDDKVYSVRHILVMPETDKADDDDNTETAEPTKEQWKVA
ncbi:MAG: peptidyl-prolyl cis-trans isomerase, partial [Eubacterium sp.]|nr:peptidyl-prolyl cis-trans isomerase [Eubacterium sp.]